MKAKYSSQMDHFRRFFYPMFANCVHATSASLFTLLNIFDQIVANLPSNATEIERFLKTIEIWVFFEKIDGFLEKKLEFFSKSPKVANLL